METIVVTLIVTISLLAIFSSYNKILSRLREENKYDTTEYLYMTNQIRKMLKDNNKGILYDMSKNLIPIYSVKLEETLNFLNVKKIYLFSNLNNLRVRNLELLDGYMIDYIKQLDVGSEPLIIVEYQKPLIASDTAYKCSDANKSLYFCDNSRTKQLYETYIASLRWD